MTQTNYDIPFSTPITETNRGGSWTANQNQNQGSNMSVPWTQWAGNIGQAMNTIQTASQAMPTLTGASTLADVIAAWEALRTALQGQI